MIEDELFADLAEAKRSLRYPISRVAMTEEAFLTVRAITEISLEELEAEDKEQMDIPNLTIGRICFDAYRASVGNKTYDGKPIPPWEALSETVSAGWEAGAQAVKEHLELAAFIHGRKRK